jgi:hypothetical protein
MQKLGEDFPANLTSIFDGYMNFSMIPKMLTTQIPHPISLISWTYFQLSHFSIYCGIATPSFFGDMPYPLFNHHFSSA